MAITLKKLAFNNIVMDEQEKNIWSLLAKEGSIDAIYEKNNKEYNLSLKLKKNFRTDGASVPKLFRWFLPKWDEDNYQYNCAAILHDALYSAKGIKGKKGSQFTREECDDFFRGGVRIAGYGRIKAGIADKCIEWFASSPEHWGDDDLDNKKNKLFTFTIKNL